MTNNYNWIKWRGKYAEGNGCWTYEFSEYEITSDILEQIKTDVDELNSWNEGYRGCEVNAVYNIDIDYKLWRNNIENIERKIKYYTNLRNVLFEKMLDTQIEQIKFHNLYKTYING